MTFRQIISTLWRILRVDRVSQNQLSFYTPAPSHQPAPTAANPHSLDSLLSWVSHAVTTRNTVKIQQDFAYDGDTEFMSRLTITTSRPIFPYAHKYPEGYMAERSLRQEKKQ
jgi:hypothetical protein